VETAVLALLSALIPLSATLSSTLVAIDHNSEQIIHPSPSQLSKAKSIHVFAFSSHGDLILAESEGTFTLEDWEQVYDSAETACGTRGSEHDEDGVDEKMKAGDEVTAMGGYLRQAMQAKVERDQRWKDAVKGKHDDVEVQVRSRAVEDDSN
jgi:exosome complex component RRP46